MSTNSYVHPDRHCCMKFAHGDQEAAGAIVWMIRLCESVVRLCHQFSARQTFFLQDLQLCDKAVCRSEPTESSFRFCPGTEEHSPVGDGGCAQEMDKDSS